MNIKMALKSRSYIFDLDHVMLSLGIFFFLSCLIDSIFHQRSVSTFIFVKNTHQKAANLMFCLISPVAQSPAWSVEGEYNFFWTPSKQTKKLFEQKKKIIYISSVLFDHQDTLNRAKFQLHCIHNSSFHS